MKDRPVRIFLDTTCLKYSADRLLRLRSETVTLEWGGETFETEVFNPVRVNPNLKLPERQFHEVSSLRFFADAAEAGKIDLGTHHESLLELWRIPGTDDPRGLFYGAPIDRVEGPVQYGRIVASYRDAIQTQDGETTMSHSKRRQFDFLRGLTHERFKQLQKATGAYQGEGRPPNPNQLMDAFLLWCAEHWDADYFLTVDGKLIRHVEKHRTHPPEVELRRPLRLLSELLLSRRLSFWWFLKESTERFWRCE